MLKIEPFGEQHIEDAAEQVSNQYRQLFQQEQDLPEHYQEASSFYPHLKNILKYGNPGVAAIEDGKFAGFLTGWLMPNFREKRSVYTPEWANSAAPENAKRIYDEMYRSMARDWVSEKYVAHYITLFAHASSAVNAWQWLGFGMHVVDAIRSLEPVEGASAEMEIRAVDSDSIEHVMGLQYELAAFAKLSPNFMIYEPNDAIFNKEWLKEPGNQIWLAFLDGEPVSFIQIGSANTDVCAIIVDDKTTSIYSAYTKESMRGKNIGTTLLAHAIEEAQQQGYTRCAVDFEATNMIGSHFWFSKKFRPVCLSLLRFIDERVV